MSLRLKFILILMLFCVGVGINLYAAIWANRVLLAEATTAFRAADRAGTSVAYLRDVLQRQGTLISDAVNFGPEESTPAEIEKWSEMIWAEVNRLVDLGLEKGLSDEILHLQSDLQDYLRTVRGVTDVFQEERPSEETGGMQVALTTSADQLDQQLHGMAAALVQARHEAAGVMSGDSQTVNLILVGMALLEFIVLMILLSLFRNWIIEPIAGISEATDQIGGGNLGYRLEQGRNDEFGVLAEQVNEMAESLAGAQRELKQSERMAAVGEMVSVVAHNIRNPLAGIRATAQAAMHSLQPGSEAETVHRRIIESVDSLEQWLKELLHLNRPLEIKLEPTGLDELVGNLQQTFKPTLERRKVCIDYRPSRPRQVIYVDRQHFTQAMASIIDNAIEASPAGGRVELRAGEADGRFRIEVADSGGGIPEGLYKQVFESYFSTKPGGTGIGLFMARKIIEAHSGELSVVENGQSQTSGATFRIEIKGADGAAAEN